MPWRSGSDEGGGAGASPAARVLRPSTDERAAALLEQIRAAVESSTTPLRSDVQMLSGEVSALRADMTHLEERLDDAEAAHRTAAIEGDRARQRLIGQALALGLREDATAEEVSAAAAKRRAQDAWPDWMTPGMRRVALGIIVAAIARLLGVDLGPLLGASGGGP